MTTFFEAIRETLHSIHKEQFPVCCPPGDKHIEDCLIRARFLVNTAHPPSNASAAAIFISDSLDTAYDYQDLSLEEVFNEAYTLDQKAFEAGVQFAANEFNETALSFVDRAFELRTHALRIAGGPLALAVAARRENQGDSPYMDFLEDSALLMTDSKTAHMLISCYLPFFRSIHRLLHSLKPSRTRFEMLPAIRGQWKLHLAEKRPATELFVISMPQEEIDKDQWEENWTTTELLNGHWQEETVKKDQRVECWPALDIHVLREKVVKSESIINSDPELTKEMVTQLRAETPVERSPAGWLSAWASWICCIGY